MEFRETNVVNALNVRVGDIIQTYGGRFRVIKTARYPSEGAAGGVVQANICEYVGDIIPGQPCSIPAHWRDGWNAQGSRTMVYAVEV